MASNHPSKQNTSLPQRRGRVKAQIFKSLAGNLTSAAGKAALFLAKVKGGSSPGAAVDTPASTSASVSTSTSPKASTYGSDGHPDRA